mgnify:CR=1 FL=1
MTNEPIPYVPPLNVFHWWQGKGELMRHVASDDHKVYILAHWLFVILVDSSFLQTGHFSEVWASVLRNE